MSTIEVRLSVEDMSSLANMVSDLVIKKLNKEAPAEPEDEILTQAKVEEYTGMSRSCIMNWREAGYIKHEPKTGKILKFKLSVICQAIKKHGHESRIIETELRLRKQGKNIEDYL